MKSIILIITAIVISSSAHGQKYESYKSLTDTLFHSKNLGYGKKISVTVPIEYQNNAKEKSYPFIIVFDSQNQRSYNYILSTIDYLTSNEQMPASVIIGVESTVQNRYKETQLELSDKAAFGSKNEAFIFDELIPYAQNNHQVNKFNMLIGHSRYGYFTSLMLTKRYKELNAVISLSPFMIQKNINLSDSIFNLNTSYSLEKNLYYRFGIGNDYPENFEELNSKLDKKSVESKKTNFKGTLFIEADHNVTPGLTIGTALYEVFEFWSKQQNIYINNDYKDLSSIQTLSDRITNHYGAPLKFSIGTLNGKGWSFYNEKEYLSAIKAWKKMVQEYPNFSEGYLHIIQAQKDLKQDYSETLKQLKNSLQTTEFYSKEELIGIRKEMDDL